jgi:leucyl-tRNA---protein transferase
MTMRSNPIQWYLTAPQDCPYLAGREMQTVLADPAASLGAGRFGHLLAEGFRRSGRFVYRHQCPFCSACVPVRVPVARFRPNRSQRRCLHRNVDLQLCITAMPDLDEHMALFRRYLLVRHPGGGMDALTPEDYADMLSDRHSDVFLIECRLEGDLVAVAVTDATPAGLSAIYTFFDPDHGARSLGSYGILLQVGEALRRGLPHLYLGYWIADSHKMSYKTRFQPCEGLIGGAWRSLR